MNIKETIKRRLRPRLSSSQRDFLRPIQFGRLWRNMEYFVYSNLYRNNLSKLALAFGSDKAGDHSYTQHYQQHFQFLRRKKLNILEIGIGGYGDSKRGGESLRMWKSYFSKSNIFGIDIQDKHFHDEYRIRTFQGSQIDDNFIMKVVDAIGNIDIIIDDGSHYNNHVIESFKLLFPALSIGGIYVVEDLQTSYWTEIAGIDWGGSKDLNAPHTSMNFFKCLIDGLNYEEYMDHEYQPKYFDKHIVSMHFYHNILFIFKGKNDEGSNMLGKRF
jgi:hypothetical protein